MILRRILFKLLPCVLLLSGRWPKAACSIKGFGVWAPVAKRLELSEHVLTAIFGHKKAIFLQVGANDGGGDDRIAPLAGQANWQGWCLEPHPTAFAGLAQTYKNLPSVKPIHAALAKQNGTITLWTSAQYTRLSSFNKNVILQPEHVANCPGLANSVEAIEVQAISMQRLVEQEHIGKLDILFVDTEGFDGVVVMEALKQKALQPTLVIFEHRHVPLAQLALVLVKLWGHGYVLRYAVTDIVAVKI